MKIQCISQRLGEERAVGVFETEPPKAKRKRSGRSISPAVESPALPMPPDADEPGGEAHE